METLYCNDCELSDECENCNVEEGYCDNAENLDNYSLDTNLYCKDCDLYDSCKNADPCNWCENADKREQYKERYVEEYTEYDADMDELLKCDMLGIYCDIDFEAKYGQNA